MTRNVKVTIYAVSPAVLPRTDVSRDIVVSSGANFTDLDQDCVISLDFTKNEPITKFEMFGFPHKLGSCLSVVPSTQGITASVFDPVTEKFDGRLLVQPHDPAHLINRDVE